MGKGETRGGRKGVSDLLLPLLTEEERRKKREKPASSHELPGKRCCMRTGENGTSSPFVRMAERVGIQCVHKEERGIGASQINLTPN